MAGSPHPKEAALQVKLERIRNGPEHPQESVQSRQSVPLAPAHSLATATQTSAASPLVPAGSPVGATQTGATSPESILLVPPTSELGRHKVHSTGSSNEIFNPKQSWDAASRKVIMGVRAVHGFKVRMLSNANAQYSFPTNDHWIYYDCCGGLTRCVLQDVRAVNCVFETFTNEHLGIHLINSAHRH